ncbi:aromatic amino acid transport family protein, partial [Desulfovibrio piger]|uniref:aromatic amino acid transport family protein n=1 Tax=Desulfovibrio piger TaxID=901 RepID=UPI00307D28A9
EQAKARAQEGRGLFDYMADLCGFDNSRLGRTKTMLITFVPPMIGGIIWPDGFLPAIGWAGLAASIWSVIVPALLLRASRRKFQASLYRVPGGSTTVPLLLVYGIIVAVCHTLYVFNLLPVFK